MQTHRLGTGRFIVNRLKRIAVPLIVFWPIMMACFIALAIAGLITNNGGTMPENPPPAPPITLETFPLTHLWFLYMLILLYGAALLIRGILSGLRLKKSIGDVGDGVITRFGRFGLLPIIMALPTAAMLIFQGKWHPYFGIPTPEYGFVPNLIATTAYGSAFVLGWLLQRNPQHLQTVTRPWRLYLVIAGLLTTYCVSQIGPRVTFTQVLTGQSKTLYALAYSHAIWMWTFGLIGLCIQIWSQESTVRRYIADSSYWLYLIHLPIIMALQIWMSPWEIAAEIKYSLILALSIPVMLLSYQLLVRYSFIGRLLNGKKRSRDTNQQTEARV